MRTVAQPLNSTMRIVDPQSATLTNIEVLSHLTAHPPRRPPNPPPNTNARNFVPSPDLRDHNTVVKEIHNYASRLSGHILAYPRFAPVTAVEGEEGGAGDNNAGLRRDGEEETPMDSALRELITRLQPFALTKGEVLMIVNLGVGVGGKPAADGDDGHGEEEEGPADQMDVDHGADEGHQVNGDDTAEAVDGAEGEAEGGEEIPEEDYGALALLDTVIEEREERLSNEDVAQILRIIRETLGSGAG